MSLVLQADNISKSFGEQQIFKSLSLKIYSGERIGITGPNGAGKSTLLKVLSGLESPDEGSVRIYTSFSFLRQQGRSVWLLYKTSTLLGSRCRQQDGGQTNKTWRSTGSGLSDVWCVW